MKNKFSRLQNPVSLAALALALDPRPRAPLAPSALLALLDPCALLPRLAFPPPPVLQHLAWPFASPWRASTRRLLPASWRNWRAKRPACRCCSPLLIERESKPNS